MRGRRVTRDGRVLGDAAATAMGAAQHQQAQSEAMCGTVHESVDFSFEVEAWRARVSKSRKCGVHEATPGVLDKID